MNIFVINLKKYLFTLLAILFIIFLIIFSQDNFLGAATGMDIFFTKLFPSLFPFLVATELLYRSNFIHLLDKIDIFSKLFNVPKKANIAIILGYLGYPIGAKITSNLKKDKYITKAEAERLLSFTNNASPIFILSTLALPNNIAFTLLFIHILSSIMVGLIFRFWKYNDKEVLDYTCLSLKENNKLKPVPSAIDIFIESTKNSILTIMQIGGFVIIFSVILSILKSTRILNIFAYIMSLTGISENIAFAILSGIFELSNGVNLLASVTNTTNILYYLIVSFLLGFSGISILFQVYSIINKEHISIKPYFYGKLMQGIFSVILTCFLL